MQKNLQYKPYKCKTNALLPLGKIFEIHRVHTKTIIQKSSSSPHSERLNVCGGGRVKLNAGFNTGKFPF